VCSPTRYGLLTGRYAWRTRLTQGVLDGFDPPLIEKDQVTVASFLKQQGYSTACFGKWHLGMQWTMKNGSAMPQRPSYSGGFRPGDDVDYSHRLSGGPRDVGFDEYFGISASLDMSPYCFIENDRTVGMPDVATPEDKTLFMNQVPGVRTKDFTLEGVMPAITSRAVRYLSAPARRTQPFFLYMPLSAPHLPVVPNREFEGKSKAGKYGDFVVEMDACVGRVLDAMDKAGLAGNTAVFFSSDNGGLWHWWEFQESDDKASGRMTPRGRYVKDFGHQGNGPVLRGTKADSWEGGHRVPFLARWPGKIKAGAVSNRLICHTDLLATCAAITGSALPKGAGEDSISMLPALLEDKPARTDVVLHTVQGQFAIRSGKWVLIESRGSGGFSLPRTVPVKAGEAEGQLYNLRTDPSQTRNVWSENSDVVERMRGLLARYRYR